MGYRQHWVAASDLAVQTGTSTEIREAIGGVDEDTGKDVHVLLNDMGNQNALVVHGTSEELLDLAGRIAARAIGIEYPDAQNQVRLHVGPNKATWDLLLPDDYIFMLDANGRRYVGITMPGEGDPLAVVTWDGDPNENTTTYPRGNKIDGEGAEYFKGDDEQLYRKCAHCHLFVEEQDPEDGAFNDPTTGRRVLLARFFHNHRGDEADEALETHEAEPEPGPGAPLTWWKTFGPPAMRSRFIDDETVDVLGGDLPRGRCDTCGASCDAITGKCMREPEKHVVALP